jgi:hypothetical protein
VEIEIGRTVASLPIADKTTLGGGGWMVKTSGLSWPCQDGGINASNGTMNTVVVGGKLMTVFPYDMVWKDRTELKTELLGAGICTPPVFSSLAAAKLYLVSQCLSGVGHPVFLDKDGKVVTPENLGEYGNDAKTATADTVLMHLGAAAVVNVALGDAQVLIAAAPAVQPLRAFTSMFEAAPATSAAPWLRGNLQRVDLAGDGFGSDAMRAIPSNGYFDVIAHGTPNSIWISTGSREAGHIYATEFNATEFASYLTENSYYAGQPIRLISCDTGALPYGFADSLSAALRGVDVLAPNMVVRTNVAGNLWVTSGEWVSGSYMSPVFDGQMGSWVRFPLDPAGMYAESNVALKARLAAEFGTVWH